MYCFIFQPNFKICTLDPHVNAISHFLHEEGYWELHFASFIKLMFEEFKDILFIDIGANMGVHSLYALPVGAPCLGSRTSRNAFDKGIDSILLGIHSFYVIKALIIVKKIFVFFIGTTT